MLPGGPAGRARALLEERAHGGVCAAGVARSELRLREQRVRRVEEIADFTLVRPNCVRLDRVFDLGRAHQGEPVPRDHEEDPPVHGGLEDDRVADRQPAPGKDEVRTLARPQDRPHRPAREGEDPFSPHAGGVHDEARAEDRFGS